MQRWVAWNQQHYAEHGHGLWAVILRATGKCIGECGLVPQQVDDVAEACFPKLEPIGRRMGAEEFRNPFFCPHSSAYPLVREVEWRTRSHALTQWNGLSGDPKLQQPRKASEYVVHASACQALGTR